MSTSVAVVVCAYTLRRWGDLRAAIASAAAQRPAPTEILLVVDHNPELLGRARKEFASLSNVRVLPNQRRRGLSGARNTAVENTEADIVAFLDDDAVATEGWLTALVRWYDDPRVMAVGGSARPEWPEGAQRPWTLPKAEGSARGELDWVVGCSYQGQPVLSEPVRNLMGCNMSFRRAVFTAVGGFAEDLGRVDAVPLGCEETELCIRARQTFPDSDIVFEPAAEVLHRVSPDRLNWSYLRRRSYAEGLSKAMVTTRVGRQDALRTERRYVARILPAALARELRRAAGRPGRRVHHLLSGGAIVGALGATGLGFLRGRLAGSSEPVAAPVLGADRALPITR